MLSKNKSFPRPSIVSPPPSVGDMGKSGTELDAALAHLRPQRTKRLFPVSAGKQESLRTGKR